MNGVCCATRQADATGVEFDEEEHIQRLQTNSFDREEIASLHLLSLVHQKGSP
jgi:hypothetical protein